MAGEWKDEETLLLKATKGKTMALMGFNAMKRIGILEDRINPETKKKEWRVTDKGETINAQLG